VLGAGKDPSPVFAANAAQPPSPARGEGRFAPLALRQKRIIAVAEQNHLWHFGQKKVERPFCTMRLTTPVQPGVTQAPPSRS